jgi:hypothetical protein
MAALTKVLLRAGWEIDQSQLRAFRHQQTGEMIEIEPGGSDVSGHFLHFMKATIRGDHHD